MLKDLPVGHYRVQIGLELRQAWLINGTLFNSEVWHNVQDSDIAHFVAIDQYLLRGLVKAHAKVPLEHLYLETAALPIPYIVSSRRLIYLQTILHRSDEEITKQIYMCQYNNPSLGDWCNLVEEDFNKIAIHMSKDHITSLNQSEYHKQVRSKAFYNLNQVQSIHTKVNENMNNTQEYLTSKLFSNHQCFLIIASQR